jgi:hypothetical protein
MVNSLFTLAVEVDSTDSPFLLVEAYVVEPLEASAIDGSDPMIWHKEVLFPPHKDVIFRGEIWNGNGAFARLPCIRPECCELVPMADVNLLVCSPCWVVCYKTVAGANYLALKVGGEGGVVFREACRSKNHVSSLFKCMKFSWAADL